MRPPSALPPRASQRFGRVQFGVILVLLDPERPEPLQDGTDAAAAAPAKRVRKRPPEGHTKPREMTQERDRL